MANTDVKERRLIALREYQEKVKSGEIERTTHKNLQEKWEEDRTSLRKSINAQCFSCLGGLDASNIVSDIRECSSKVCSLWHVRPYK